MYVMFICNDIDALQNLFQNWWMSISEAHRTGSTASTTSSFKLGPILRQLVRHLSNAYLGRKVSYSVTTAVSSNIELGNFMH